MASLSIGRIKFCCYVSTSLRVRRSAQYHTIARSQLQQSAVIIVSERLFVLPVYGITPRGVCILIMRLGGAASVSCEATVLGGDRR